MFDNLERLSRKDIDFLTESITPTTQKKNPPRLAHPNLWWNNLSNIQKAIRRGDVEQATDSAYRLYGADPIKFRRRLCVIALEDVAFGDLLLVATVLGYAVRFLGRQGAHPDSSELGRSLTLVKWLACTVKDRSACELATASIDPPVRLPEIVRIGQLSPREAANFYANREIDMRDRCLAGWALSGNLSLNQRRIGARDHTMLGTALEAIDLPEIVRYIAETALRFGGEISLLATNIPPLYQSMRTEEVEITTNVLPDAEVIQGMLSPSFDVHTRSGLRALAAYATKCQDLRRLCTVPGSNLRRVVGAVGFRAEGSAVDKELSSPLGDRLHELNEWATCAAIGLPYESLADAKRAFLESLDTLNELRRYYAAKESKSLGIK